MTAEQLRQHITAVPFFPFHVRTADGWRIPVLSRDFILITPPRTHVFTFQPDGAFQVIDINLFVGVEFGPSQPQPPVPHLNA
jgi:hypothetical protein